MPTPIIFEWVSNHRIVVDYPLLAGIIWTLSAKWVWLKDWFNRFNVKQDVMTNTTAAALKAADEGRLIAAKLDADLQTTNTNHLAHLQSSIDATRDEFRGFAAAIIEVHKDTRDNQEKTLIGQQETNRILGLLLDRSNRES